MLATMTSFTQTCPQCGLPWELQAELVGKPASDFDSCAFRCLSCRIGFSNAKTSFQKEVLGGRRMLGVDDITLTGGG